MQEKTNKLMVPLVRVMVLPDPGGPHCKFKYRRGSIISIEALALEEQRSAA